VCLTFLAFRYDAACRVIARVTKERDDALALVQGAESRFRSSAAAGSSAMEVDGGSAYPGISMEIKTKISEIGVELLQQRKRKVVPEGLAAPETLSSFKAGKGAAADKEKSPMVRSPPHLTLTLSSPPHTHALLTLLLMQVCLAIGAAGLTVGSESGTVSTFNPSTGSFTSSIKQAHDGHVTCIAQSPIGVMSGGSDGCVKLWTAGACKHTFRDLGGAVVGVSVHPCGDYAAAAGESGCWAFYDLAYGTCRQVFAQNAPLSTGVFHPDGLIFATAEKGDSLQLWDLKSERPALKFSAGVSQRSLLSALFYRFFIPP
jgi:pre-mRNA-processing factor 19